MMGYNIMTLYLLGLTICKIVGTLGASDDRAKLLPFPELANSLACRLPSSLKKFTGTLSYYLITV